MRCVPGAFLDYSSKKFSGEVAALESLRINPFQYLCLPWVVATPVAAIGILSAYTAVFLLVDSVYPLAARLLEIPFVEIHAAGYMDFSELGHSAFTLIVESVLATVVALAFAIMQKRGAGQSPLTMLKALSTVRAMNMVVLGFSVMEIVSFLLF
jgi:hypothetical protein